MGVASSSQLTPSEQGGVVSDPAPLNPLTLLPKDRRAYRYSGSLTTPPCSEGVNWLLLANPIQMSTDQIAAFRTLFPLNARPVQPLHDRPVLVDITIGG